MTLIFPVYLAVVAAKSVLANKYGCDSTVSQEKETQYAEYGIMWSLMRLANIAKRNTTELVS